MPRKSSAENDAEQIEAEVTAQTENADTEEEEVLPEGKYRSELTNELIDDSLKDQRPIAVMVDNESIALPHYGLSHADVVYEMMNSTLNGRITRSWRCLRIMRVWIRLEVSAVSDRRT